MDAYFRKCSPSHKEVDVVEYLIEDYCDGHLIGYEKSAGSRFSLLSERARKGMRVRCVCVVANITIGRTPWRRSIYLHHLQRLHYDHNLTRNLILACTPTLLNPYYEIIAPRHDIERCCEYTPHTDA